MKKTKVRNLGLIIIAMMTFLFVACSSGTSSSSPANVQPTANKDTTVLVYVLGTDLETNHGNATGNIAEMMKVGSTANMNVVIQTGGSNLEESKSSYKIKWQQVQRWYVEPNNLKLVQSVGADSEINMGSESALASFIQWGVKAYPAKKYILVLWDHGGGPNVGMGADEITESVISTPSILKAVASANTQFEIVGFDECLMGSGEIAAGLMPYAKYMVGSEDIEPGAGWNYTPFLAYVTAQPNATGAQIGKVIVDSYAAKMNESNDVYTLSVTQLDKMQAVIDTTNALSAKLAPLATSSIDAWESLAYARLYSLDYQTSAFFSANSTDLVDMKQFTANINKNFVGNPDVIAASDAVSDALNSAVIYESSNYSNLGSTGLTVYFPSIMDAYESKYTENTISLVTGLPYFAADYTSSTGLVATYYNFYSTNQNDLIASVIPSSINVSAESISAVISNNFDTVLAAGAGVDNCNAFTPYKKTKIPLSTLSCYSAMMGNTVTVTSSAMARNYDVSFRSTFKDSWPTLGGKNVALIPNQSNFKTYVPGDNSAEYMIPVALDYNGPQYSAYVAGYLRVEVRNGMYTIVDFQAAGNPAPKSQALEKGQTYYLGAYVYILHEGIMKWRWGYLNDSTFKVPDNYDATTHPVTLSTGAVTSPSQFTFIVAGITGEVNVGESVTYSY